MRKASDKTFLKVVALFGLVSLLADMSYEGFRSILAPLIENNYELGAIVGAGEFIAWGLRPVMGVLADVTASYWGLTIIGYGLVPLGILIATQGWPWLALGYGVERLGKAIRSPARDALLAGIAKKRRGFAFGLHELLDQVGAVLGPVIAALSLAGLYGLWVLAVPGSLSVLVLLYLMSIYPGSEAPRGRHSLRSSLHGGLGAALYVLLGGMVTANPIAVQAVVKTISGIGKESLVLLYSAAMLSDAIAALPLGMLYDTRPRLAEILPPVFGVAAGLAALLLGSSLWGALAASLLSGVAIAGYETVARAMVKGGATGYGVFGLSYGVATALSIALYSGLASMIY